MRPGRIALANKEGRGSAAQRRRCASLGKGTDKEAGKGSS